MGRKRRKINFKHVKWGRLTRWLRKHQRAITRSVGNPFTKTGEINDNVLRKLVKNEKLLKRLAGSHWRHIQRMIRFKLRVLRG